MKRFILILSLISIPLCTAALAQKANRVESGIVDAHAATWIPPACTFASPPSSPKTGQVCDFTDASASGVCSGTGTSLARCRYSGSTWVTTSGTGTGGSALPVVAFNPNTATSLPCPSTAGAWFQASTTLTGPASIPTVACSVTSGTAVIVQISLTQGGTVHALTLPSPFNQCDFDSVGAGVTLTESGTYDGTDFRDVSCSPSDGPPLDPKPVPTITGCGTVGSQVGNSMVGTFTSGQTTCAPVLAGLPAAPHGYVCTIIDRTLGTGALIGNISDTTASATFPAITTTSGDVMAFSCKAY